jgi:protein-S-isoprenylcysteine O-methyltransferase Ste14
VSAPVLLLSLVTFAAIGLLPRVFFRRDGRLVPMWWVTAFPFFLCPVTLLLGYTGALAPLAPAAWQPWLDPVSALASAASFGLICLTIGTHRVPIALWHQDDDAPRHLVTYGAYARIRHPFYAAFLLAFLGAATAFPHAVTLLALAYGLIVLNATAAREERRLTASAFGEEYRRYLTRTGRFLPRPVPSRVIRLGK